MKTIKLFLTILFLILFFGCSTSNDSNGNSTTAVVPLAPSNLSGTIVNNQVVLTWTDNSTNETGFKIERKTGTGSWSEIGTLAINIVIYTDKGVTEGTAYTYRVYSFNTVGSSLNYTNEVIITMPNAARLPVVTTFAITSITTTAATSGGSISSDGGAAVTARGVVWSTNTTPTIALSTKTIDGTGAGSFTSAITTLTANTTYYMRAYATNSVGTEYGNQLTFTTSNLTSITVTDIDGNNYQTVTICNQVWTKTNLNVSHYQDGTLIPQVTDPSAWKNLKTGAWCYYNNNSATGAVYGKLYNYYAVAGIYDTASYSNQSLRKKLAPTGWQVPYYANWTDLTICLGDETVAGGKMKETGTTKWISPNSNATNSSGFNGFPGGSRTENGVFMNIGYYGSWWSSSENGTPNIYNFFLNYDNSNLYRYSLNGNNGFSVRLLKN